MKIRPLSRSDLPLVAELYSKVVRRTSAAPKGLLVAIERILFDSPWADPDIPSLVCENIQGRIAGFLAVHARRLCLDGLPLRLASSGPLVTDPDSRSSAPGLFLLRTFLAGPQDLSMTDGATAAVQRMWEILGGEPYHTACLRWTHLIRPLQWTAARLACRGPAARILAGCCRPTARLLDATLGHLMSGRRHLESSDTALVPLTPELLVQSLPTIARSYRLYPNYDRQFAEWLFAELTRINSRGTLHTWAVPGSDGQVQGWFIYYLLPRDSAILVQLVAARGCESHVLDRLFAHAAQQGAIAVQGRLEPNLWAGLSQKTGILHFPEELVLMQSRRPETLHAIHSGRALLTRLEGEWWLSFHRDRYGMPLPSKG